MSPFLKKSFNPTKCKTLLQLVVQRIKLLRNKKSIANKKLRGEIAKLIEKGQDSNASLKVESLFREENLISVYDILEQYCQMVINQLPSMKSQKVCPPDLKEPVACLIYCAPLCKDLQELQKLQKIFKSKYGSEFSHAAVELRPDCGVTSQIVQKLSTARPDPEMKLKLLKEVAQEHNLDWKYSNETSDTVEVVVEAPSLGSKSNDTRDEVSAEFSASSTPKTSDYDIERKSFLDLNNDVNDVHGKLDDGNIKVDGHEILNLKTATEVAYVSASQAAEAAKVALDLIIKNQGWKAESDFNTRSQKTQTVWRSDEPENEADHGGPCIQNDHTHMSEEMQEQAETQISGDSDFNTDANFGDSQNDSSIDVVSESNKSNYRMEKMDTSKTYEESHISESDPETPIFDDYESDHSIKEEKHIPERATANLLRLNQPPKSPNNYFVTKANDNIKNVSTENRNVADKTLDGLESPKSYAYSLSIDDTPKSIRQNKIYDSNYTSPKSSVNKPQYDDYTEVEELSYWSSPVREFTSKSYRDRKPSTCKKLSWHSKATHESESIPEDHDAFSPLSSEELFSQKESVPCYEEGPSPVDKYSIPEHLDSVTSEPAEGKLRWKTRSASEDSSSVCHLTEDEKTSPKHNGSPTIGKLEHQVSNASRMSYQSVARSVRSRSKQSPTLVSPTYSVYENIYSPIGGR